MSYPEYQKYRITVEWLIGEEWFRGYFLQMYDFTPEKFAELSANLRLNWWPEFVKTLNAPAGVRLKGPYLNVTHVGEDTWCANDGFYWTFDTGQNNEELRASWADYCNRHFLEVNTWSCRCEMCRENGIVRMQIETE